MDELIAGHDGQFYNKMGMHKHVFWSLLFVLQEDAGLHKTRHISCEEQLEIFLHYVHRGLPIQALKVQFQRSGDTISMYVPITNCEVYLINYLDVSIAYLICLYHVRFMAHMWSSQLGIHAFISPSQATMTFSLSLGTASAQLMGHISLHLYLQTNAHHSTTIKGLYLKMC